MFFIERDFGVLRHLRFSLLLMLLFVVVPFTTLYALPELELVTTPNWTAESDQDGARMGYNAKSAGDVNGDGYVDVVVGIHSYDNGETNEGRAIVYYGSASGLSTSINWSTEGNQVSASYGASADSAGDVNGDGYDDVIVGANNFSNGQAGEGKAFVYHGSSTGLSTSASWTYENNIASSYLGSSVAGAGDINNDGYDDVLVGTVASYPMQGRVYLFLGSSSGLGSTPAWNITTSGAGMNGILVNRAGDVNGDGYDDVIIGDPSETFDFVNRNREGTARVYYGSSSGLSTGLPDWWVNGNQAEARFGFSVSTAGDVNNDGYDDVIVGSLLYDNGQTDEGRAFVYLGSSSGLSTSPVWTGESDQAYAQYGFSVSTAGDVNLDGYDDVAVGSWLYDNGQIDEGRAFVYLGSSSGVNTTAVWTGESDQTEAHFGTSVAGLDIRADGIDDLLLSADMYDGGQTDEGKIFLYDGVPETITGLQIVHSTPIEPGITAAFTATVSTGQMVTYDWEFLPHNQPQTTSGSSVLVTFPVTYTVLLTATNSTNSASTSTVITLQ